MIGRGASVWDALAFSNRHGISTSRRKRRITFSLDGFGSVSWSMTRPLDSMTVEFLNSAARHNLKQKRNPGI